MLKHRAGFLLLPRSAPTGKLAKSIAVLPFDNFSDDKGNEHFADGIQDDVLTSLAKIGDLPHIGDALSRADHNIRENLRATLAASELALGCKQVRPSPEHLEIALV